MQKSESTPSSKANLLKNKWMILGLSVISLIIILFFLFSDQWFGKSSKQSKVYLQYIDRADRALINDSLETALQFYFMALDIDDRLAETYGKISESYFFAAQKHKQNKNFSMVEAMLKQSLLYLNQGRAKHTDHPYFHYISGLHFMEHNQTDSAIYEMAYAYAQGVRTFYLHLFLSDMYNEKEETSLCLEQLKAAENIKPDDPKILFNLGEIYFRIGDYGNAVKHHFKLTTIDPNSIEYRAIYAASLWKNGEEKTAKNIFNQILHDKNIHQLLRHHIVAWTLIDRDLDYEWGIRVANVSLEIKNDVASMDILGWGYYKQGDYKKSVHYLTLSYNKNPSLEVKQRLEMAQEKLKTSGK